MGGFGSGRRESYNKKTTIGSCLSLETKRLKKSLNHLTTGQSKNRTASWCGGWDNRKIAEIAYTLRKDTELQCSLTFHYSSAFGDGDAKELRYSVKITATPCRFGGKRWWFNCPGKNCSKKVVALHLPPHNCYFLCRHCHDLTYQSCQDSHKIDWFTKLPVNL